MKLIILLVLSITCVVYGQQSSECSTHTTLEACKAAQCHPITGHHCDNNDPEYFFSCIDDNTQCAEVVTCAAASLTGAKAGFPTSCIPFGYATLTSSSEPLADINQCCKSYAAGEELYSGEPYDMMYEEQMDGDMYDPYGTEYDVEYEDIGDASPMPLTDEEIAKKCTPFDKPAPLAGFNAAALDGVWFEIATSVLPRLTSEADCYCSFMNNTLITDPKAKQQLEGRALFDLMASCKKGGVSGTQILKIGQGIQIHPTSDPSSFQYFMVDAKKDAQGNLVPVLPPKQQTATEEAPKPQTSSPSPATASPQQPSLADTLVPNLITLKSIGEGVNQSVIMAGPCMETIWVMSRQKSIDDDTYKSLLAAATAVGIDLNKAGLTKTVQEGCPAPS